MTTHHHLIACTKCSHLTTDPGHRCTQQLGLGDMLALPCTSCGEPSWYSYGLNRYIHAKVESPSTLGLCWLRNVQGRVDEELERSNVAAMMRHERRRKSVA